MESRPTNASLGEVILFLIVVGLLGTFLLSNLRIIPQVAGNISTITIDYNASGQSDAYQQVLNGTANYSLSILTSLVPYASNILVMALLIVVGLIAYVMATSRRTPS